MKKLWTGTAIVAALALAVLIPAVAQVRPVWAQTRQANFMARHMIRELNLSNEQVAQIKTILQNEQPKIQQLVGTEQQMQKQLRSKNTFDEAFVRSVAQQETANATEALVEREKIRAEIMDVLTPAQQQSFTQMSDEWRSFVEDRLSHIGDQL